MVSQLRLATKVLIAFATILGSTTFTHGVSVSASAIGSLDSTFGDSGLASFNIGSSIERASKVLIDDQGRTLVIGKSDDYIMMSRFTVNGAVDTSFGDAGNKVLNRFPGPSSVLDAAFTVDNKIVVVWGNIVLKLHHDGEIDTSFGSEGSTSLGFAGFRESLRALVIQNDGKILAVGSSSGSWRGDSILAIRLNADGTFDSSFGDFGVWPATGRVWLDITNGIDSAHRVLLQSDSKILISGVTQGNALSMLRLNANGSLDTAFATNGVYTKPQGAADVFSNLYVDQGGKILFSGACLNPNQAHRLCITKLNATGSVDSSFGNAGVEALSLPAQVGSTTQISTVDDGKILLAGTSDDDFVVTRLTPNGSVDTSFGINGTRRFGIAYNQELFASFVINNQEKILLAGTSDDDFVVTRLTPNGFVDTSFGDSGFTLLRLDRGEDYVTDAVQLSNGQFLIAGASNDDAAVIRIHANGSLDRSFGVDGKVLFSVTSDSEEWATKIVIQQDSRILIGGTTNAYPVNNEPDTDLLLVRLHPDGSLDTSFGNNGFVIHDLGKEFEGIADMQLDSTGRLLVGANSGDENGQRDDFLTLRFLANGIPDTSFGTNGIYRSNFGTYDQISSILVQPDGKILLAGLTNVNVNFDIALVRINEDGTPDLAFGANGKVVYDAGYGVDEVLEDVVVAPDGKIVVTTAIENYGHNFLVARFLSNGVIDTSFNNGGTIVVELGGIDWPSNIHATEDGSFLISGSTENGAEGGSGFIRLNANGVLDTSFGDNGVLKITMPRLSGLSILSGNHLFVFGSLRLLERWETDFAVMKILIAQSESQAPVVVNPPLSPASPPTINVPSSGNTDVVVKAAAPSAPSNVKARTGNNSVRLTWTISNTNESLIVRNTTGTILCRTASDSCDIKGLKNGRQYEFLLSTVNSSGAESTTASKIMATPGFQVKRTTMKTRKTINLSSVLTTPSRGKKTWQVVSGRCSIRGSRLVAPSKSGTCRLRLSTAKQGSYGAMSTTVRISVTK